MRLRDLAEVIDGAIVIGQDQPDLLIDRAFAADLLSDVLALTEEQTALVTGMTNPQVMRVAEILNVMAVILVRGKQPPVKLIEYAKQLQIPLLTTKRTMFETCGLMYANGVRPCRTKSLSEDAKAPL
jgi:predicted transcriptional regulator